MTNNSSISSSFPSFLNNILPVFLPVLSFSLVATTINFATIIVILRSKTLSRPGNYPIVSILLGSAIQASLTVPAYTLKRLHHGPHGHLVTLHWICDFYRLSYFICGHQLKVSLFLVSCDRLIAIQYPYRYKEIVTKKRSLVVLLVSWVVVVFVDMVPFFPLSKQGDTEGCTFVPQHSWSIFVITVFNVLVFCCTFINYASVWRVTALMTMKDHSERQTALRLRKKPSIALTAASPETQSSITPVKPSKRCSSLLIHKSNEESSILLKGLIKKSQSVTPETRFDKNRGFSLSLLSGDHTRERSCTIVTDCSLSSGPKIAEETEDEIEERKPSVVQFSSSCKDPCHGRPVPNNRRSSCPIGMYSPQNKCSRKKRKSVSEGVIRYSSVISITSLSSIKRDYPLTNNKKRVGTRLRLSLPASSWTPWARAQPSKVLSKTSLASSNHSASNSLSFRLALEMKSTKTALMLLGVYLLCWGSLGMFYLADNLCHKCISKNSNLAVERLLVKVISFTSSVFLPLVYCWRTDAFWKELKDFTCVKICSSIFRNQSR